MKKVFFIVIIMGITVGVISNKNPYKNSLQTTSKNPNAMYITITSGKVTAEEGAEVEKFLSGFLPKFKKQPGVLNIYHFFRSDKGEEMTIVIWENEDAVKAYRQGELIKEPIAFEKEHNMITNREGYPLIFVSGENK